VNSVRPCGSGGERYAQQDDSDTHAHSGAF
jgi:hypothetical protein